jgi:aspartyl protease family protein
MKKQLLMLMAYMPLLFVANAYAVEKLEVQGLFSNKAVLMVDGKRHVIAVGESSPEGVKVISANSRGAVLEVDGKQKQYNLGSSVSTTFAKRKSQKETIFINSGGMYMTFGNINGRTVRFLVDTGATTTSIPANLQDYLQLKAGQAINISTANGVATAYMTKLEQLKMGEIRLTNIKASLVPGFPGKDILLGMNVLKNMELVQRGDTLIIRQYH